jgi:hypothetical protein
MEKVKKVCADGLGAVKHRHGGRGPECTCDEAYTVLTEVNIAVDQVKVGAQGLSDRAVEDERDTC